MNAIAQQPEEIHYMAIQVNEQGKSFVLCKNCRKPVLLDNHPPRKLGELCSIDCERENAEFYK